VPGGRRFVDGAGSSQATASGPRTKESADGVGRREIPTPPAFCMWASGSASARSAARHCGRLWLESAPVRQRKEAQKRKAERVSHLLPVQNSFGVSAIKVLQNRRRKFQSVVSPPHPPLHKFVGRFEQPPPRLEHAFLASHVGSE